MTEFPVAGLTESSAAEKEAGVWPHIRQALQGLRYGQVLIVVQDGVIVQVDRTERQRFQKPLRAS